MEVNSMEYINQLLVDKNQPELIPGGDIDSTTNEHNPDLIKFESLNSVLKFNDNRCYIRKNGDYFDNTIIEITLPKITSTYSKFVIPREVKLRPSETLQEYNSTLQWGKGLLDIFYSLSSSSLNYEELVDGMLDNDRMLQIFNRFISERKLSSFKRLYSTLQLRELFINEVQKVLLPDGNMLIYDKINQLYNSKYTFNVLRGILLSIPDIETSDYSLYKILDFYISDTLKFNVNKNVSITTILTLFNDLHLETYDQLNRNYELSETRNSLIFGKRNDRDFELVNHSQFIQLVGSTGSSYYSKYTTTSIDVFTTNIINKFKTGIRDVNEPDLINPDLLVSTDTYSINLIGNVIIDKLIKLMTNQTSPGVFEPDIDILTLVPTISTNDRLTFYTNLDIDLQLLKIAINNKLSTFVSSNQVLIDDEANKLRSNVTDVVWIYLFNGIDNFYSILTGKPVNVIQYINEYVIDILNTHAQSWLLYILTLTGYITQMLGGDSLLISNIRETTEYVESEFINLVSTVLLDDINIGIPFNSIISNIDEIENIYITLIDKTYLSNSRNEYVSNISNYLANKHILDIDEIIVPNSFMMNSLVTLHTHYNTALSNPPIFNSILSNLQSNNITGIYDEYVLFNQAFNLFIYNIRNDIDDSTELNFIARLILTPDDVNEMEYLYSLLPELSKLSVYRTTVKSLLINPYDNEASHNDFYDYVKSQFLDVLRIFESFKTNGFIVLYTDKPSQSKIIEALSVFDNLIINVPKYIELENFSNINNGLAAPVTWKRDIAFYIIESLRLYYGTQLISNLTGELLHIIHTLYTDGEKQLQMNDILNDNYKVYLPLKLLQRNVPNILCILYNTSIHLDLVFKSIDKCVDIHELAVLNKTTKPTAKLLIDYYNVPGLNKIIKKQYHIIIEQYHIKSFTLPLVKDIHELQLYVPNNTKEIFVRFNKPNVLNKMALRMDNDLIQHYRDAKWFNRCHAYNRYDNTVLDDTYVFSFSMTPRSDVINGFKSFTHHAELLILLNEIEETNVICNVYITSYNAISIIGGQSTLVEFGSKNDYL